ncbi:MAG: Clp protease N-terminal domain-containing protein [Planctomycetota bacterium]
MFDRFTDGTKRVMDLARLEAQGFNHEYLGTEHILLGLLREGGGVAANVLRNIGIDRNEIRSEVEKVIDPGSSQAASGQLPLTPQARRAMRLAQEEADDLGHKSVGPEHLLLGLIKVADGTAAQVLGHLGVELADALRELLDFLGPGPATPPEPTPALDSIGRDLGQLLISGDLARVAIRERHVARLTQILARQTVPNPLLVGEPGVGKHSIAVGLAQGIVSGETPDWLRGHRVVAVNPELFTADVQSSNAAREFGQALRRELHVATNVLLYIEGLRNLVTGPPAGAAAHAAEAIRGALSQSAVRCIATASPGEYADALRSGSPLAHAFQPVQVAAATPGETRSILRAVVGRYEEYHRVSFRREAIELAIRLSGLYLPERPYPAKAVDVLDEAGVHRRIARDKPRRLQELDAEIEALDRAKEEAVDEGRTEHAARLRDETYRRRKQREQVLHTSRRAARQEQFAQVQEDTILQAVSAMTGVDVESIREERGLPAGSPNEVEATSAARFEARIVETVLPGSEVAIERGTAFVLLPHQPAFDRLYDEAIAPALLGLGLAPEKGDDIGETGAILPQVWRRLRTAEVLIVVASGKNPNVIYELGLCHGIRRSPILLVEREEDLPFNLRQLRFVQYDDTEEGRAALRRELVLFGRNVLDLARWS